MQTAPEPVADRLFDCAIIGGGIAGLSLACLLAGSGKSVLLLEKEKYPFHKVCGEYISMESYGFLCRLGLPLTQMDLPMIRNVQISAPSGTSVTRPLQLGGFGLSRFCIDDLLAKKAREKGAMLKEETRVTDLVFEEGSFQIKTDKGSFRARLACGAWGRKANLDVKLARPFLDRFAAAKKNYLGVKYHIRTNNPDNLIGLHNFEGGYCGISNVESGKTCLCYLTDSGNLKRSGNSIKQMEQNVLMQNPFLKKIFTKAEFLYEQPLTISQVTFSPKTAVENHVLMLGDAAGTIAPLCGNGMSMGMRAAAILHELAIPFLEGKVARNQLENSYKHAWEESFGFRVFAGRMLQHLFGRPTLTAATVQLLNSLPSAADSLIKLTHGKPF